MITNWQNNNYPSKYIVMGLHVSEGPSFLKVTLVAVLVYRLPSFRDRAQGILQVELLCRAIAVLLYLLLAEGDLPVSHLQLLADFFCMPTEGMRHLDTSFMNFMF
jgi:hypothetical protein